MARPILIERYQVFKITCNDCGEVHEEKSWLKAKRWLPIHRRHCSLYQTFFASSMAGRGRHGEMAECPVCLKSRYLEPAILRTSRERNTNHPELIGIHRTCRMKIIKPARKIYIDRRRIEKQTDAKT